MSYLYLTQWIIWILFHPISSDYDGFRNPPPAQVETAKQKHMKYEP